MEQGWNRWMSKDSFGSLTTRKTNYQDAYSSIMMTVSGWRWLGFSITIYLNKTKPSSLVGSDRNLLLSPVAIDQTATSPFQGSARTTIQLIDCSSGITFSPVTFSFSRVHSRVDAR